MPFWSWFKLFIHTRFLNQFFPQSGNIYRGFALKKKFDISYTNYITSFASFAWMDTCFNFIIASAIVLIFEPKLEIFNLNAGLMIFGLTCITIISPYFLNKISVFIEKKSEKTLWIHKKSNDVLNSTINNMKDFKFVSKILLLGILAFIRTIAFYYVLFKNFNVDPNLSILVIFYALFKLSSFFIITPGNLGIQEIAFGFLSAQLGIGISEGILVCATGRVIGVLVIIILGISTGGYDLIIQERANKNNL